MIAFLMEEKGEVVPDFYGKSEKDLEEIWRGLVNIRPASLADIRYLELEEAYLKQYHTRTIVGLESCQDTNEERVKLYHGDLCHLEVDAIVNAANSDLLGCFIPNGKPVTPIRKQLLEKCYMSCLKQAEEMKLESIAFCGISTGQFGFPVEDAAQIAVSVVKDWVKQHVFPETVILSTYTNEEQMAYRKLLQL